MQNVSPSTTASDEATPLRDGDLRVIVMPPQYTGRARFETTNPTAVDALEGSRIRLEFRVQNDGHSSSAITLYALDGTETPFTVRDGRAILELAATSSRPLLIRERAPSSETRDRLIQLRVTRDERPFVFIREPAKDLMFASGSGQVPLQIEAQDDLGLNALSLRFTRVSGAGETFTFEEGEWPLEISRDAATSWRARAVLSLDRLQLQEGDTLVYRAVARDAKPGADPVSSNSYLIEVGRLAGVASQGFAVPEERDRHALSQQMLIIKTERLHADRGALTADAFLEQSQLLAVEQRMVKAEFVFMTGGHVEDELEEAAHSHELAEGRMENSAQVELLNAIREMSRAEARLNAADVESALQFERAALKALQRAFDRRRYLLRTLPERTRIDPSRRLTGELDSARSSSTDSIRPASDATLRNAREMLRELSVPSSAAPPQAVLAARLLDLDSGSESLQKAALQLAAARDASQRTAATQAAQRAILELMNRTAARAIVRPLARDRITGRLVQELPGDRQP
jgi:hypothetical protein